MKPWTKRDWVAFAFSFLAGYGLAELVTNLAKWIFGVGR